MEDNRIEDYEDYISKFVSACGLILFGAINSLALQLVFPTIYNGMYVSCNIIVTCIISDDFSDY